MIHMLSRRELPFISEKCDIDILGGFSHVAKALKALMKGVQANEEVDEDELEDMVLFIFLEVLA